MLLATLAAAAAQAASDPAVPSQKNLEPAVRKYLEERGDFCLGKFEWPIAVGADDRQARSNNAVQMPVLEKLGLVTVADAAHDPTIQEYSLTDAGKKYYLAKPAVTLNSAGQKIKHQGDLCPVKLKLDKVLSWEPLTVIDGQAQTTVTYTYKIEKSASWAQNEEVRKVFPMLARVLDHPGTQHLVQLFAWSGHGWVAVTPGG